MTYDGEPWLINCEYSQIVTQAARRRGVEAYSCDILETEGNKDWHICGDAIDAIHSRKWGGMIAHPPCTRLTLAGARWYTAGPYVEQFTKDREVAIEFFLKIKNAPIKKIAIENPQPMGYVMDRIGRYDQKVQPWQFGITETKGICLWLKGLPLLKGTKNVYDEMMALPYKDRAKVHYASPGKNRGHIRSRFFPEVADAMVDQWIFGGSAQ